MAMNRQQRRNAAKQNAAGFRKAAHATDASIEKRMTEYEKEIHKQVQNQYMGMMYCIFALVCIKLLKFGPVRTLRVLNEVAAVVNDMNDGIIDIFDLKRDAEDAGMAVVFDASYNIIEVNIFEEDKYAAARKKVDCERMLLYEKQQLKGVRLWTDPEFKEMKGGV